MDNAKLSDFESIWYRYKICKICLEKYEAMQDHIANNHDEGDFPEDEAQLNTSNHTSPGKSDPSTDVKPSSTKDTQTRKLRKRPTPAVKRKQRRKVLYHRRDTDINRGKQKHPITLTNRKSFKFTCEKCSSVFSSKWHLEIHMRKHTGERPFICDLCPKSFTQVTNLNNHYRIHTGDRPFKCKYCSKCFTQVTNLTYHERIHTGNKPYKCENCGKKFAQIANWSSHVRIHHNKKKS